ncbi:MAG TPA: hypothetical protein VKA04_11940 [Pseudodesulfovibrio sp.]|nr:hypothetical protein [Pseudodesulfovibrio sp.]
MAKKRHPTFNFILVLDGFEPGNDAVEDSLFEAGCDDALLSFRGSTPLLEFDRTAPSLEDAIFQAIENVEVANVKATVLRVEPDDLVTASEIARRTSSSREAVRLWHEGERGPGSFPPPVATLGSNTMVWSWAEVSAWLLGNGKLKDASVVESARFLARLNALLNEERYHHLLKADSSLRNRVKETGALKRLRSLARAVDQRAAKTG